MADEARLIISLQINKGNLDYQSRPTAYSVDIDAADPIGPSPGAVNVPLDGVDISFTQLVIPSLCWMQNLDDTNFVEIGIYDPQTAVFYPLLELQAGECYVVRLTRNLMEQYAGSGTGTTGPENYLRLKANTAPCIVRIDAFEK